ncbi:MAG: lysine transporter LysE [Deltaproteobacteria bacterium HGW-Deltaproteobacteria-21]|jgi:threonine/homoserine/homoserine lactone efflux protein|nr:MAG: lysine transporter LysE [Deltaproteobacteria bacterium HGW-Deltaproteobacteria-21]
MEHFILFFLQGATLALTAAVMPGPFQAFLLSRSLSSGWKRTLPAALAPLVTDGPILALVLLILTHAPVWFLEPLRIAGGIFILFLAKGVYRTLKTPVDVPDSTDRAPAKNLLSAIAINALNPNPYIFWSVVGGPLVLSGWRETPWAGAGFLSGFFGTFVASLSILIVLFGTAGRLDPALAKVLYTVSLVALIGFGLYQIGRGVLFWL